MIHRRRSWYAAILLSGLFLWQGCRMLDLELRFKEGNLLPGIQTNGALGGLTAFLP